MQSINLLFDVLKNCFCTSIHLQKKKKQTLSNTHDTATVKTEQVNSFEDKTHS